MKKLILILLIVFICIVSPSWSYEKVKCEVEPSNSQLIVTNEGNSSIVCVSIGVSYCFDEDYSTCETTSTTSIIKCSSRGKLTCIGKQVNCTVNGVIACSVDFRYLDIDPTYTPQPTNTPPQPTNTPPQPTPTPTPTSTNNNSSKCLGNPICGGIDRGYCTSFGCRCFGNWVGADCLSSVVIINPTPVSNTTDTNSSSNNTNSQNNVKDSPSSSPPKIITQSLISFIVISFAIVLLL